MELHSELPSAFPDHLQWYTVPIPKARPITGYVAGPFFGTQTHWVANRSRPCMEVLTRGRESCPLCPNVALREVVYLPFYGMLSHERLVIILSKTTYLTVKHARFGDLLAAQQDEVPKKAAHVMIVKDAEGVDPMPAHLAKAGPQCIRTYLTHLWGLAGKKPAAKVPKAPPSNVPLTSPNHPDREHVEDLRRILRERIARSVGRDPNAKGNADAA